MVSKLKNCGEGIIEIWDLSDLEEFLLQERQTPVKSNYDPVFGQVFEGFAYFGLHNSQDMKDLCKKRKYEDERDLSPLEVQAQKGLSKDAYHRALVFRSGNDVAGILICQWTKCNAPFWRYHIKFIDVRDDYKNKGVGTNLVKALDQADFIQGHILQRGISSDEGKQFIAKVMDKELKGNGYALIPAEYMMEKPPTKPGIYDAFGELAQPEQRVTIGKQSLFHRLLTRFTHN